MVRLKDITVWINWDNMTFQFQYGAIKRAKEDSHIFIMNSFQFQYGAIKSIKDSIMNPYLNLFQFQYGAIKSHAICSVDAFTSISIPVWCD